MAGSTVTTDQEKPIAVAVRPVASRMGAAGGLDAFADPLVDHDSALHSDLVQLGAQLVGAAGAARDAGDEDDAGAVEGDQGGGLAGSAGDPAEFLLGDLA